MLTLSQIPYECKPLLGGSARTSLVVTCSPEPEHVGETMGTMRFGQRAMRVENSVRQQQASEYRVAVRRCKLN